MDNIQEKVKELLNKVLEWWKRFTTKQKILIGGIASTVVLMLVILAVVLTRPHMQHLITAENVKEAASIKEILDSDSSIRYEISDDGMNFRVNSKQYTAAKYLLGTNRIATDDYTIDDVLNGSFSTTEADKTKRYQLYLEKQLAEDLSSLDNVADAKVNLNIPVDDGTILARNEKVHAAVKLELFEELEEGQAEAIARFVATAVGNDTTETITILDSHSNPLYIGGDENSSAGVLAKQSSQKTAEATRVKNEIRSVVLGTNMFDNVEVGLNLVVDYSTSTTKEVKYSAQDGRDEGLLTSRDAYEQETIGGYAGVPGTDSNGEDTTYVIDDGNVTSNTISDITENHALDTTETETVSMGGGIDVDASSVAVVAITYKYYVEDNMKAAGQLDDQTFDEFVAANNERVQVEVPQDFVSMIANATGFPEENISVAAYEQPYFEYSTGSGRTVADYVEIALAVLIFALLGYVVFRSTRPENAEELEPELSVEALLESTKAAEEALEDIGYAEKSETRILIEKFVEEKPEAAASLLRNWLEEEWE